MDFLFYVIKVYLFGLTYLGAWVYGIAPAVFLIILWMLFRPKPRLELIDGEIESYGHSYTHIPSMFIMFERLHHGTMEKVTFRTTDNNRIFFKRVFVRINLWRNIGGGNLVGLAGKFCGIKTKNSFEIFAFGDGDSHIAFLDDMKRPHSIVRVCFNVLVHLSFILFFPYVCYSDYLKNASWNSLDRFFELAPPLFMFSLILFGYPLYRYIKSLATQRQFFNQQMQMLEQAGIPKPLG